MKAPTGAVIETREGPLALGQAEHVHWACIRERSIVPSEEAAIRELLVAAFPRHAQFFATHSYWGSPPEYRLIARGPAERLVAHLEFGYRTILVGDTRATIAGIGAVAVHPEVQGQRLGQAMFAELRRFLRAEGSVDFGFLECREAVARFYERAGLYRVKQSCISLDPDTGEWDTYSGPVMVLPARKGIEEWPDAGFIHLQGMPW